MLQTDAETIRQLLAAAAKYRKNRNATASKAKQRETHDVLRRAAHLLRAHFGASITGRVCPAPCETTCIQTYLHPTGTPARELSPSIKAEERFLADQLWEAGLMQPRLPEIRRYRSVGIVGSGPAGLATAFKLIRQGYAVTVFDKGLAPATSIVPPDVESFRIKAVDFLRQYPLHKTVDYFSKDELRYLHQFGGLLRVIPTAKLPHEIIDRELLLLIAEGVRFEQRFINDFPQFAVDFDHTVAAPGMEIPRHESQVAGTLQAIDFLREVARRDAGLPTQDQLPDLTGKTVVVWGAGDTADDTCKTAWDLGAEKIIMVLRRPKLGKDSYTEQRLDFPSAYPEENMGVPERIFSATVKKVQTGTVQLEIKDKEGNYHCVTTAADVVFEALGFVGTDTTTARLEEAGMATNGKLIFTGNPRDAVQGVSHSTTKVIGDAAHSHSGRPNWVITAIDDGYQAAEAIAKQDQQQFDMTIVMKSTPAELKNLEGMLT